ncbi:MAG: type VI secretion system protein TssA [Planctomycetes bacterium]|nr:type VI secretion system protein TssA [Planctomycetota bacterium]
MPAFDEAPVIELGKRPISGSAPCGVDAGDDPQYINVQAELSKMDRIESEPPDWYVVEQDATALLTSKSKDVEVAAALGLALFKRYSYAGLSAALGLMNELVNNFWDGLFPERPRRRKSRVESLADRFTDQGWFRENQPKGDDFDLLDECIKRADTLKASFAAKLPDEPLEFDKFVRGLKEHAGKRPKAAAPAGGEAAAPADPGAAPAAGGAAFVAGAPADVGSAVNAMLSAATFVRKADPTDPIPYAVVRIVKWAKIVLPASDAGKFQIPPPENSVVEALAHQQANGLWENLLKNAEAAFRSSDPLWLDVQRYVCAAMAGLGAPYEKARAAVVGVTGALVQRLGSGLYELKFKTGVPLCSGETRMWIEAEVAPARGGGAGGAGMSNGRLQEAADKARQLAGTGKLKEALKELQDGLLGCPQRRDRLLWRLRIAQLCCDAQRLQLASPLLEECYDEIRRYHIDEWEPALAVEVAQTLYRCRKSLTAGEKAPSPEAMQRVRESYAWLCQLDPLAALAAEPSGA